MLQLKESIFVEAGSGDRFLDAALSYNSPVIGVSFDLSNIPDTWDHLGRVFQVKADPAGDVIAEQAQLTPGRINLIRWRSAGEYRIAFRLVKYVREGILNIYTSDEPASDSATAAAVQQVVESSESRILSAIGRKVDSDSANPEIIVL